MPLLDKREVAQILRITPSTLDRLARDGAGPARTIIGGRVLFEKADVDSYLLSARQAPTAKAAS